MKQIIKKFKDFKLYENLNQDTIIYHGTNKDFSELKLPDKDSERTHEYYGDALYFTDSYDVAKNYALEGKNNTQRIFEFKINDSLVDYFIDAKGRGIKDVNIRELVEKGGIIKIENIYDSNLMGAQNKNFPYGIKGDDDYKYPKNIYLEIRTKRLTKDIKEKINKAEEILKDKLDISKDILGKTFYKKWNEPLTKEEADKLLSAGLGEYVYQQFSRTPKKQTTYVIAGEEAYEKLKNYNKNKIKIINL
jgi:hypothetical protein